MIASWQNVVDDMEAFELWTREWFEACQIVVDMIKAWGSRTAATGADFIAAMTALSQNASSDVRAAAAEGLAVAAEQSNEVAMTTLLTCIADPHGLVRRAAVSALAPLVLRVSESNSATLAALL